VKRETPYNLTKDERAEWNLRHANDGDYIQIESMKDEDPLRSDDGDRIREGQYAIIARWFNTNLPCKRVYYVDTKRQIEDGEQGDTTLCPSQFRIVSMEEYENAS
jgi:hypothetical protein